MSVYGKLIDNGFDILDIEETDTSLVRGPQMVRLSYKHDGKLIQYVKNLNQPVITNSGSLLVANHGVLVGTKDRLNHRTVAKLLADISQAQDQKQIPVGLVNKTAYLLPVQIL